MKRFTQMEEALKERNARLAGVKFAGIQWADTNKTSYFMLCIDPKTGTSFRVMVNDTLSQALARVEERYDKFKKVE